MIETEGLTGAETLLRVLSHMGVDRIFSSPGSEWSPVWEAFAKAKAQSEGVPLYISSRHEEVAVGMASGYAKSTGKLPAVMIHTAAPSIPLVLAGVGDPVGLGLVESLAHPGGNVTGISGLVPEGFGGKTLQLLRMR